MARTPGAGGRGFFSLVGSYAPSWPNAHCLGTPTLKKKEQKRKEVPATIPLVGGVDGW